MAKPIIGIDIDDVIADTTESVRVWGNTKSGIELKPEDYRIQGDYWRYYERVWEENGLHETLIYDEAEADMVAGKIPVPVLAGASFAIKELQKKYKVILITARSADLEPITKKWLDEHFADSDIEVYFANNPKHAISKSRKDKGEICKDLGVSILIDDSVENCKVVLDAGVEAVLFGTYGWHVAIPEGAIQCKDWPAVLEYFDGRQ